MKHGGALFLNQQLFSPAMLPGMTSWMSVSDAVVSGGFVISVKDRISGQLFSAVAGTTCPYTASDANFGGRASTTTTASVGMTFTQNLVTPGSARTVVIIGRCNASSGGTILQMSGENTHRVGLIRLSTGGYLAVGGASSLVTGNSGAVPTTALCTIYTMNNARAIACDAGGGNLVLAGSPMSADDTGSTVAGGALLTQISGLFGYVQYTIAEMLVYSRVLNPLEQTKIRAYSKSQFSA